MARVEVCGISKSFGATAVLRDIGLSVEDGEFVVLVGPSGCGKSTLLRTIAGLDEVDSGTVLIGGNDVTQLPPAKRRIAMVFQSYALYPQMTVYQNMAFGLRLSGEDGEAIDAAVRNAARLLDIEHLLDRRPKTLSGGQRQRVAIGRAIVREPAVFLFDEPLSNLDAALRVRMRYEFAKLHQRLKTTTIYVTHDQVEAMTLADRIAIMDRGQVEQFGTPDELYHDPQSVFVASFIGSPRMNLLEGVIDRAGPTRATVTLAGGAVLDAAVDASRARPGDKVTLGIRPEHLRAQKAGIVGEVALVESLGNVRFAYFATAADPDPLVLQPGADEAIRQGETLSVGASPDQCHLFDAGGRAFSRVGRRSLAA
ncbi:MAG: multiple sugar transport system ATP-binding protein [Sphingomonadales bacterium]|nr:multiple sugar transport system ATP-binding protein [Sphingomonadales bacterium]